MCVNHYVFPTIKIQEHVGNDKSCVWHTPDFSDGVLKEEMFCIRFGYVETYEILSDEEKKNYDLYGDEKGNPGFGGGNFGNGGEYTSGGPGGWQMMGAQGNTKSFSFSCGSNPGDSASPFGFDVGDMFNLFGGGMKGGNQHGGFSGGSQYGGFTGSGGTKSGFASTDCCSYITQLLSQSHRLYA